MFVGSLAHTHTPSCSAPSLFPALNFASTPALFHALTLTLITHLIDHRHINLPTNSITCSLYFLENYEASHL